MRRELLWLRWSWRDLKARWLQVLAIAMVIALGTGSYAGLSSVTRWRRISSDHGYASLRMYDLKVALAANSVVAAGSLQQAVRAGTDAAQISGMQERLAAEIQVDASYGGKTIIVAGIMYGSDGSLSAGSINAQYAAQGRNLAPADSGAPVVMLEGNFARYYDLPAEGTVRVNGARELRYVGQAMTPEYFLVTTERGGLLAEANFAAVFTSLATAQGLSGNEGKVNELLITLPPGADRAAVKRDVEAALTSLPGAEVTTRDDNASFRLNDRDIDGDQQVYDILALLIFAGAVGAAFNLSARLVEAQRREIGIAMILGLSPARIAVRPMLVGAQIAVMGVVLGVGVGYVIGSTLMTLVRDLQPLPQWHTPFQVALFGRVAAIGFFLPLAATAWPVWRAVRVKPIEAIWPSYRSTRGSGLAPLFRRLRLPGNTLSQTPVRNLMRSPRRTLLTSLGIAAALAALIAFVGMIDSFVGTTDRGDREILGRTPDRVEITLATLMPEASPAVQTLLRSPVLASAEPRALVGGTVKAGDTTIDVQVEFIDLGSDIWTPTLVAGALDRQTPGIYLSELGASDLSVGVGDTVTLRHPRVGADGQLSFVDTPVRVLGVHAHPFRFVAYMDTNQLQLIGPVKLTNTVSAVPAPGVTLDQVKQTLLTTPAVSSVRQVGDVATAIRELLDQFVVVLRVVEVAMLLIALLIAFNSASINIDERAREHATMFAFGVPVGTVVRLAMIENLLIGLMATAGGVLGGWYLLQLIIAARVRDTMPDIYIKATIAPETLALAVVLGVVMVALSPLLLWRRLLRLNIPAMLKVVE